MKKRTTVIILILLSAAIIFAPLFLLPGAEFEGSDGQGSEMVYEVSAGEYEPWVDPILERFIGGELPPEMETLLFCIQTGIGVGVLAYFFGYFAGRKKYGGEYQKEVSRAS